jgi:Fe-S-cluster containining protein
MSLCESCHAGCCRSFAVPVTGADILRIENQLGLSFWDFVCRWADSNGQIAMNHAPHFHFADEPQTPFTICLRHEASAHFADATKCRFLVERPPNDEHPRGVARCGVYESRPAACRVFPTKFSGSGDFVVLYDVPASSRDATNPAYQLCPRPWEPSEIDPIQSAADLVVAKYEMNFFHNLAEVWNRRPQPWEVFPDFLRLVYAERVQRASSVEELADDEPWLIKFPVRAQESQTKAA